MLCTPSLSSPLTSGEQLRFRGRKKNHSVLGNAIVVQFGKLFPARWAHAATATVDEEMTITYSDLIHATVALLHDSLLPHLAPLQIFQQLCHERSRTLVVIRDIEEAQRELSNSNSNHNNNRSTDATKELEAQNNNNNNTEPALQMLPSQMMRSLRMGIIGKPWQKIVPSLSAGSDGNGLSGAASVSSPEDEAPTDGDSNGPGSHRNGSTAASDATQSPGDRQWVSWATMNRRNKEEIMNECGSICSDHPYSDICHDDDSSDDDESIPEDDDDAAAAEAGGGPQFARSLEAYVKAVQQRRRDRIVGIESRLVACATFYKDYRPSGAKVVVLSHLAVRKKFRRYGIGSFMLKRIKSPSLVGPYDAITMHVHCSDLPMAAAGSVTATTAMPMTTTSNSSSGQDLSSGGFANANTLYLSGHPAAKMMHPSQHQAHSNTCLAAHKQVAFFEKNAFTCDIILNSRFREEEVNVKTGDVLMCYLPPFDNGHTPYHPQHSHTTTTANICSTGAAAHAAGGGVAGTAAGASPTFASQTQLQQQQQNSIKAMHEEAQRWREKSLEAYQVQMSYMARLQQEVLRLHELLNKQEGTIEQLRRENTRLSSRLVKAEKKTAKALIETLDKEAADFERMCSARKQSTGTMFSSCSMQMSNASAHHHNQHNNFIPQHQQQQQQQQHFAGTPTSAAAGSATTVAITATAT